MLYFLYCAALMFGSFVLFVELKRAFGKRLAPRVAWMISLVISPVVLLAVLLLLNTTGILPHGEYWQKLLGLGTGGLLFVLVFPRLSDQV